MSNLLITGGAEEPCVMWQGYKDKKGYGRLTYHRQSWGAHEFAYVAIHGSIPKGLHILHKCNNKSCWNPAHLYAGTRSQNVQDSKRAGTFRNPIVEQNKKKTHCPKGHAYTPQNTIIDRKFGWRECRSCENKRQRENYKKRTYVK